MSSTVIKLKEKIGYGFGDAASSMYWKIFTFYLAIFYTDVFGIPAAAAGTMFLVTRIWDTANDPIMGIIGDRTNTRWGKFRPYLLWIAAPFAIIGVLLFTTPDLSVNGKIVYAYITYTLMMMAYTAINVPYASLLGVMTARSDERTSFASYRMVFAFGGSLLVVAIFQPTVDFFNNIVNVGAEVSYQLTMVVIGVIAIGFFLMTFSWTRERIKPPKNQESSLKEDFKNLLGNIPWFVILGAGVMTLIFNSVRDGVAMYYFKYYVVDETAISLFSATFAYSTLYLFLGQATNMLGVIMAKPVSARIGKRKTFMYAMFMAAALSVVFYFCDRENYFFIYLLQALISFCAGIIFPLMWSMYADAADYSQYKTGRRATGLVFSASSMSQKLGWTLGGSITLWLLAFFGFEANVAQTPETIQGIKYMMSFVPGVAALVSGAIMIFYKLSDDKMDEIIAELERRREAEK
ncbi:GPH family glycoside/pentoside/hexuronide:cation symporter [Marinilabilia salmonicolor]|jgi:GPH family glycoside/pentoside/hexuronide:cation symporter|uniref:MFS transporter n=1 Tax=Marinilabilia salmonicolor TaxID=989 RepID=UPI000D052BB7|nr:MFS transporter [Marinilabilia salmonicolor]PRZ01351.1 GPH family glycoside/pentoside/hexuronide:cation symporter [Marinilabilia salmonicolor]